ncbi:MAG: sensor histidine kinase [Gammaproteobacteria bacterium]|nr:sensor histidine kinase [Gammaproteobacteria bacterium]
MSYSDRNPDGQLSPTTGDDARIASPAMRFLPDFCSARVVVEILLIAELVAIVLTMARGLAPGADVMADFISLSLFMLWQALASAAVLCLLRRKLLNASSRLAYLSCYAGLLLVTLLLSLATVLLDRYLSLALASEQALAFVGRNIAISAIVSAVAMRYFYIQYEWQQQVQGSASARIAALQARIRPHFLFNSLNTVAALIPSEPDKAEHTVLDLADLFRASLAQPGALGSFKEECELAEQYLRLEKERIGERLQVDWDVDALPDDWPLPRLTLQPLLENAIYHGIEKSPDGGRIHIKAAVQGDYAVLRICNPLPIGSTGISKGLNIALENTRERLRLALGRQASLTAAPDGELFATVLTLPRAPQPAGSGVKD